MINYEIKTNNEAFRRLHFVADEYGFFLCQESYSCKILLSGDLVPLNSKPTILYEEDWVNAESIVCQSSKFFKRLKENIGDFELVKPLYRVAFKRRDNKTIKFL